MKGCAMVQLSDSPMNSVFIPSLKSNDVMLLSFLGVGIGGKGGSFIELILNCLRSRHSTVYEMFLENVLFSTSFVITTLY
jgi:hypothetical protein